VTNHSTPSVAIILVNWNGYAFTKNCLESLAALDYRNFSVLVVDNASSDGSVPLLKGAFPSMKLIENESNLGFTGGNNLGISAALEEGFDYILLLNNDTEVRGNFLSKLVETIQSDSEMGIIQPLILFNQNRSFIWSAGGIFHKWLGKSTTQSDRMPINRFKNPVKELDWATGCCMLIRATVFKEIGLLNDSFFAYFEDVDFSIRANKRGFKIGLEPSAIIFHEAGAASKKKSSEGELSPTVFYLTARNQLFQLRLHVDFPYSLIAWPYQILKFMMWISYFCARFRFKKAKAVMKGMKDGFTFDPRTNNLLPPR
jgi:GT2 family glycosyltransferase